MPDQDMRETYNRAVPTQDLALIGGQIAAVTEELTTLAASAAEPRKLRAATGDVSLPVYHGRTNSEPQRDTTLSGSTAGRLPTTSWMSF